MSETHHNNPYMCPDQVHDYDFKGDPEKCVYILYLYKFHSLYDFNGFCVNRFILAKKMSLSVYLDKRGTRPSYFFRGLDYIGEVGTPMVDRRVVIRARVSEI